jgi:hypothetical protein
MLYTNATESFLLRGSNHLAMGYYAAMVGSEFAVSRQSLAI